MLPARFLPADEVRTKAGKPTWHRAERLTANPGWSSRPGHLPAIRLQVSTTAQKGLLPFNFYKKLLQSYILGFLLILKFCVHMSVYYAFCHFQQGRLYCNPEGTPSPRPTWRRQQRSVPGPRCWENRGKRTRTHALLTCAAPGPAAAPWKLRHQEPTAQSLGSAWNAPLPR